MQVSKRLEGVDIECKKLKLGKVKVKSTYYFISKVKPKKRSTTWLEGVDIKYKNQILA